MKGILADHNADGHLEVLLRTWVSDDGLEMLEYLLGIKRYRGTARIYVP